jgi:hypothetical protein
VTAAADAAADLRLDGNAAAGLLDQLFAFEITTAVATCIGCGHESAVGALDLYDQQMGVVLRCPGCAGLMICATRILGVWRVDLSGLRMLRVEAEP